MAIVTYNRSIDSFHGSVGRMVFYKRNGQTLLRSKGKRNARRSKAQILSQEAFRTAAACWKEFSAPQKEPWRSHGRMQGMTGYNAFLKLNIPRLKRGESIITEVSAPDDGCARFMESIHDMIRRISRESQRTKGPGRSPVMNHSRERETSRIIP